MITYVLLIRDAVHRNVQKYTELLWFELNHTCCKLQGWRKSKDMFPPLSVSEKAFYRTHLQLSNLKRIINNK